MRLHLEFAGMSWREFEALAFGLLSAPTSRVARYFAPSTGSE